MLLFLFVLCGVLALIPGCQANYPFATSAHSVSSKPTDPFLLQFHHTRYFGGCFEVMRQNYPYNTIVPFIQNFDLLITSCSLNWDNPIESRNQATCPIVLNNRNTTVHTMERVHVHADYRHNKYFIDEILPYFVQRHKETGVGIILHTGGGDSAPNPGIWPTYVNTPAIFRWVVEQDRIPELLDHPKVMFLPVGICVRENAGIRGTELRVAIADTVPVEGTEHETDVTSHTKRNALMLTNVSVEHQLDAVNATVHIPPYYTIPGAHNSPQYHHNVRKLLAHIEKQNSSLTTITSVPHAHRLLKETMRHAKSWEQRLDRVYLCFNEGPYEGRKKFMDHVRAGKCSICDYCNQSMPSIDLWRTYGEYKYVVSPYGNGADCGRSWEIMLMGAVPVIEYFPGGLGYERGGLAAVTVQSPEELTVHSVHQWNKKYPAGQDATKLTMEYWRDRMFDEHIV